MRPEEARRWIEDAEQRFGDPAYFRQGAEAWFPSIAEDEEAVERMHRIWLLTSSPGSHAAFRRMNVEIDVRHVLPTIRVRQWCSSGPRGHTFLQKSVATWQSRFLGRGTRRSPAPTSSHGSETLVL